ncbi:MAG: hypothetical protein ACTSWY_11240, partial [Promethearchaeota archaeon]
MNKMNKKISIIILFSVILLSVVASMQIVLGKQPNAQKEQNIAGNSYKNRVLAQNETTFQFQNRTRIRVNSSVNLDLNIDCDALEIGEQNFSIDILEADGDLELNMTCS